MTGSIGGSSAAVRAFNRSRVLAAVASGAATSRSELAQVTGLSRSTVTALVVDLLGAHEIVEQDATPGDGPGRPSRRLGPAPRTDLVVAVDLGHSHCRVGVVDSSGTVRVADNVSVDVDSSADQALARALSMINRLLRSVDRGRVSAGGLGLPAPVDIRSGSVGEGNVLPRWIGRRPGEELEVATGIPFVVDNDANLGALAEATWGVARGSQDFIYVKASTGIGAGLMLGGRIHHGTTGRAGEIGHVPVDPTGPVCRCGNRGCLESAASVTQVLGALRPRHGASLTLADVLDLVAASDTGSIRVLTDSGRLIGRVLADVVNSLNPEQIVLGGELAGAGACLRDGVRESIQRYAQPGIARDLRIDLGALGAQSELLGAAALALVKAVHAGPHR